MAISYSLDMAAPVPADQVAHALRDAALSVGLLDPSNSASTLLEGTRTRTGTWVRVVPARPRPWDPVITDLGFTPTVLAIFRLDKMGALDHQQDDVVRLVAGLLARVAGDAVLHFQNEVIWLLRRDGKIAVSERDDIWPPQRLAGLSPLQFVRQTHTFSEE